MAGKAGSVLVGNAVLWIERHREEWLEVQRVCLMLEDVRDWHGRPRYQAINRGGIYQLCQIEGIELTLDETFRRDHDLWSTLARYLVQLHPRLSRVIHTRSGNAVDAYVKAHGLPKLKPKYVYRPGKAA